MEYCGAVYSFHAERDIKTGRAAPQTLHAVVNGAENDTANGSPGYRENSGPAAGTQSANIDSNAAAPSMNNIRSAEGKSQGKSSGRASIVTLPDGTKGYFSKRDTPSLSAGQAAKR